MNIYKYILLASLIILLIKNLKYREPIPYLTLFLLIACLLELPVQYYFHKTYGNNHGVYNFLIFLEIAYYQFIFIYSFRNEKWIRILRFIFILWTVSGFIYFLLNYKLSTIHNYSYLWGLFSVCVLTLIYFNKQINSESYVSLYKDPIIWFSLGILLFICCVFPILWYGDAYLKVDKTHPYNILLKMANIILSSGYLAAVLCRRSQI